MGSSNETSVIIFIELVMQIMIVPIQIQFTMKIWTAILFSIWQPQRMDYVRSS